MRHHHERSVPSIPSAFETMENEFHQWLLANLPDSPRGLVGLGDDAAVLEWSSDPDCVVTSDMLAEGVHFLLKQAGAHRVGRKSLAVNLSDLAAMGATPIGAVVSIMLPRHADKTLPRELMLGIRELADQHDVAIVGGDTNCWTGDLVISVCAFGTLHGAPALRRDGAQPGDVVMTTGPLGGSRTAHHLDFQPQVAVGRELRMRGGVTAAMDISDGLAIDSWRMARHSRCGIELDATAIPITTAARQLSHAGSGKSPLEHALSDGEDFELLVTVPDHEARTFSRELGMHRIGQCVSEQGLWLRDEDGERTVLQPLGYEH